MLILKGFSIDVYFKIVGKKIEKFGPCLDLRIFASISWTMLLNSIVRFCIS